MNDYCEECSRWQDRIAAAAGDARKQRLLQKLYRAHLDSHARVTSIWVDADRAPKRDVVEWANGDRWTEVGNA